MPNEESFAVVEENPDVQPEDAVSAFNPGNQETGDLPELAEDLPGPDICLFNWEPE